MNKTIWTSEEDLLLQKLRNKNLPFSEISEIIPNHTQDALRNRAYVLRQQNKESWLDSEVIGFLDIEASDLEANRGYMLSWAIKYLNGEIKSDLITKKEIFSGRLDKRITKSLIDELKKIDVIVTYYGTGFDIPFIRTRALHHNLEFPVYGSIKHIDIYYQVKSKLKLHRNSLDAACKLLGFGDKTYLDIGIWQKASLGDKDSLDYILAHNLPDVEDLEKLYLALKPFGKYIRKSI